MIEKWKDIDGYEGLYQVSNMGHVKSLYRKVIRGGVSMTVHEKMLKQMYGGNGYYYVDLHINGKRHYCRVHRLVAKAFLDNPSGYKEINHKDENKANNNVTNLEWCDRKYNCNYSLQPHKRVLCSTRRKAVQMLDEKGNILSEYPSVRLAAKTERIGYTTILNAIKSKRMVFCRYWREVSAIKE